MPAVEFSAKVIDGKIEIPDTLREQFNGEVGVILFADAADRDPSAWPQQNRRRWELIAKKAQHGLSKTEANEFAALQQLAEKQLAEVGERPTDELEILYHQLTQKRD